MKEQGVRSKPLALGRPSGGDRGLANLPLQMQRFRAAGALIDKDWNATV